MSANRCRYTQGTQNIRVSSKCLAMLGDAAASFRISKCIKASLALTERLCGTWQWKLCPISHSSWRSCTWILRLHFPGDSVKFSGLGVKPIKHQYQIVPLHPARTQIERSALSWKNLLTNAMQNFTSCHKTHCKAGLQAMESQ